MTVEEAKSRCWAQVDLSAVAENYNAARSVAGRAQVIPVIKADAYGCGASRVAKRLYVEGARLFAVATVAEAMEVKRSVNADALVLGMPGEALVAGCVEDNVILTAYSLESARLYSETALRLKRKCRTHLKVNTGLNRLGFDDMGELSKAARLPGLSVEGLYTHLALHDDIRDQEQFELFDKASRVVDAPKKHMLDSIGLFKYPQKRLDAVRIGAFLFGVNPSSNKGSPSKAVVSFYAKVVQTRLVKKGGFVGYDDVHTLSRDTVVATVSAGYADGYPRKSELSRVEIRGRRAKVLGLVCMDQLMADVTDIPGVAPGDVVTLLGGGITLAEFSSWWDLNRNEAISRIGRRTPRVYKDETGTPFAD